MTVSCPVRRDTLPVRIRKAISASVAALLLAASPQLFAGVLIWPVTLTIGAGQKAASLWLENRGDTPKVMQLRVFSWTQRDGENRLGQQDTVVGSPPMMRIEAGGRQMVRLIHSAPLPSGQETTYRVLVDEIPNDGDDTTSRAAAQLRFQMRYSIPLFVDSGIGADSPRHARPQRDQPPVALPAADTAALSWRTVQAQGKRWLEISNQGHRHVRLSELAFASATPQGSTSSGMAGYVLGGSRFRWPLPENAATAPSGPLTGIVDGQPVTIAKAAE